MEEKIVDLCHNYLISFLFADKLISSGRFLITITCVGD